MHRGSCKRCCRKRRIRGRGRIRGGGRADWSKLLRRSLRLIAGNVDVDYRLFCVKNAVKGRVKAKTLQYRLKLIRKKKI